MKTALFIKSLRNGFTLIELMIVIAVIAVLSAIALVGVGQAQKAARDSQRQQIIKGIQAALECYQQLNGSYPTTATFDWDNLGTGTNFLATCYPNATIDDPYKSSGTAVAVVDTNTAGYCTTNACGTVAGTTATSPASGAPTTVSYVYVYDSTNKIYTITLNGETRPYIFEGPK